MKQEFIAAPTIYETDNSTGKLLYPSSKIDYVHLTISPNSSIESHSIELDIDFFVIEGSGMIGIGDEIFSLVKGDMISVKPNIDRYWKNTNDAPLVLLGIKHKN